MPDPGSRVVSISRKDRAAIGLAAKAVEEVYWLADERGEFVTSGSYHAEYPAWLAGFNAATLPLVYSDSVWESMIPPGALSLTRPDTSRFELDGEHTFFPHRAREIVDATDPSALNHWRYEFTPLPDRAVVSLALEAIQELQLRQRGGVDYLGISLSQTVLVGHYFGPLSREQLAEAGVDAARLTRGDRRELQEHVQSARTARRPISSRCSSPVPDLTP